MKRLLLVVLLSLLCAKAHAANNVWTCPVTSLAATGPVTTTTLYTAPATGFYDVKIYISPASAVAAGAAVLTLGFTENGTARTMAMPTFSLTSLSVVTPPALASVYADAGTSITYALSSTLGTYNMRLCYKMAIS